MTNDVRATVKGYHQLKDLDEAMAAEGETVVRAEAKAESVGASMYRSSMGCTSKTSNYVSTQERCNIWALKESPTSPRSSQRPTRKDTVTSNALGGM